MKTTLLSLLAATALGLVAFASGALGAADLLASGFAIAMVAWTIVQYGRPARPLELARPIRFPAPRVVRHAAVQVGRLAA